MIPLWMTLGLVVKGKGSVESSGRRDQLARNLNEDKLKHREFTANNS